MDALVGGLFDYAGMFPPAALPFDEALQRSAAFPRTLRRPHLLGTDMVLSVDDVGKLTSAVLDGAGFHRPCRLCIVGFDPEREEEALDAARRADATGRVIVTSLEAASEEPLTHDWTRLRDGAHAMGARLYIEPRWEPEAWLGSSAALFWRGLESLQTSARVGAKVRCAGPTAVGEAMADVLVAADAAAVPLKATQGLHHPFPGPDRHGFLTVTAALRLRTALGLRRSEVDQVLAAGELDDFAFDDVPQGPRDVLVQRLSDAAHRVPFSIGSCSLDEPDAELAALLGGQPGRPGQDA